MSSFNKTSIYKDLDNYQKNEDDFIEDMIQYQTSSKTPSTLIDDTTGTVTVAFLPEINKKSEIDNSIENKIDSLDNNMFYYLDASFQNIIDIYDPSYVNLTQQYLNDKYDYLTLKEKEKISKTTNSYELLVAWTIIFFILLTSLLVFVLDDNIQLHLSVKIVLFLVCLYMFYFICMNIYGYFNK